MVIRRRQRWDYFTSFAQQPLKSKGAASETTKETNLNKVSRTRIVSILGMLILILSSFFTIIPAEAGGKDPVDSKISGRLAMHVRVKSEQVSGGISPQSYGMNDRTRELISADQNGLNLERVFIYFSEQPGPAQIDELISLGIKPYPETWLPPVGNHPYGFILADMPIDRLGNLAGKNYVTRIDTAERQVQCQNDITREVTWIEEVWSGGNSGEGVRVAVLDSGIDVSSPDFPTLNSANSKDYSGYPTLDDEIKNTVTGHGTHVAGSVVGRGVNSSEYKGAAPGADLIFLKIGKDNTSNASVDAITYAIRDAVDVYQADIITISYGGWSDYHDGSDGMSQAVDYAVDRRVTVFVAAGNSGNDGWHYSGTVNGNSSIDVPISVGYGYSYLDMNLVWFDGLGVRKSLKLGYYTATGTRLISESIRESESPRGTESLYCYLNTSVGQGNYLLKVTNNSSSPQSFHLYYSGSNFQVEFVNPDPEYTLNSPAEADGAIAVGAYVSRRNWQNFEGDYFYYGETTGTTATFSSRGPRVDNDQIEKPEIIAPGSAIISVRDNDVYPWPNINGNADISDYHYNIIDNDGQNVDGSGPADYFVMQGTSMACPAAAGVAALMLRENPGLMPAEIREVLIETATDMDTPGFDTRSGWGLINAAEAVSEVTVDWAMGFSTPQQNVTAGEASGTVTLQIRNRATGEEQEVFSDTTFNLTSTSETGRFDISPTGSFDGTCTYVTVPAGASKADFYYRDTAAGTSTITVSGEGFGSISQEVNIFPAAATVMSVETAADGTGTIVPNQSLVSGESVTIYSVTRDEFGNLTDDSEDTAWSLVEVSGEVTESDLSAVSGSSVTLTGNLPGATRIRASLDGLEAADSGVITVMSGTVDRLEITGQPDSSLSVDHPFDTPAVVTAYDADDNPVIWATITAEIDEGSGTGELTGTLSRITDSNGQAVFDDLRYNRTDEFRIKFVFRDKSVVSDTVGPLAAGAAASLSLAITPTAGGTVDEPLGIQPVIKVEDRFGNAVGGAEVTASVNTGTGELRGSLTTSSAEDSGLATFTNLGYSKSGESFSIRFTCGELTVDSDTLGSLEPGEAVVVQVEKQANGTGKPVNDSDLTVGARLKVYSITRDQYGNFVENAPAEWSLVDKTGGVTDEDLVPAEDGKSAILTGKKTGTAIIRAAVPGLTVIDSGIITIKTAPSIGFFGGFGGTMSSATLKPVGFSITTEVSLNNNGIIAKGLELQTVDGRVTLGIADNTKLLNEAGNALSMITAAELTDYPQAPPNGRILLCYEFGPEKATFNPPLKLTFKIDALPEGVDPDSLRMAYWNGTGWDEVPCTVDAATGIVAAEIEHFSQYAVLVDLLIPAEFVITGIRISPVTVQPDEQVTVQATVENTGSSAGTYRLVLKIDGVEFDSRELMLEKGESQEETFKIKKDMPGDYLVDINGQTGRFSVEALPVVTEIPEPSGEPGMNPDPGETTPLGNLDKSTTVAEENNPGQPLWLWLLVGVGIAAGAATGGVLLYRRKTGKT
jgi:subtilisin family serine protease